MPPPIHTMVSVGGLPLPSLSDTSLLPPSLSEELQLIGLDAVEQPKPWWIPQTPLSGVTQVRHSGRPSPLSGGFAAKGTWSMASSIASSCSSLSSSNSRASSPGLVSGTSVANTLGLNQRLESLSSCSRYFSASTQDSPRSDEDVLNCKPSPTSALSRSSIKLPWFFPQPQKQPVKPGACSFLNFTD